MRLLLLILARGAGYPSGVFGCRDTSLSFTFRLVWCGEPVAISRAVGRGLVIIRSGRSMLGYFALDRQVLGAR